MQTLIAIPAMSWVYTDFMQSMLALDKPDAQLMVQTNSLVYDARNNIAWAAIQNGADRVLWLDSDMSFEPDLLTRLNADMDENGLDCVSAFYTTRSEKRVPCIYKDIHWEIDGERVKTSADPVTECPDVLFEVAGMGFGAVLMKTELIKAVIDGFGPPFQPMPYLGEDLAFFWRAGRLGRRMWCDGRINVGHIGTHIYRREHVSDKSEPRP